MWGAITTQTLRFIYLSTSSAKGHIFSLPRSFFDTLPRVRACNGEIERAQESGKAHFHGTRTFFNGGCAHVYTGGAVRFLWPFIG